MRVSTVMILGLVGALFPREQAKAEWRESTAGSWRAAYSCDASGESCVAVSCEAGQRPKFGIWSKRFQSIDASAMRREGRFDIAIDGAASSLAVERGDYLAEKRIIFWPMDEQLLTEVLDGRRLVIAGWGDPEMDLRDEERLVERTVSACTAPRQASLGGQAALDGSGDGSSLWNAADAGGRLAILRNVMPAGAACELGEDASCRFDAQPGPDRSAILARFDGPSRELAIRAEFAGRAFDDREARGRLYDVLSAFGIPRSFADRCLGRDAVSLDVAGSRVSCDSYTPDGATVATIYLARR